MDGRKSRWRWGGGGGKKKKEKDEEEEEEGDYPDEKKEGEKKKKKKNRKKKEEVSAFQKGTALRRVSIKPLLLGLRLLATSVALTLFRLEQVPFFHSPSGTSTAITRIADAQPIRSLLQRYSSYLLLVENGAVGRTNLPVYPSCRRIIQGYGTFRKLGAPRSTSLVGTTSAPREP